MNGAKLYFRYIRLHLLSELQYRGWPLKLALVFFTVVTDPLDTVLMLRRFGSVGSWSASRLLLLYALAVCSFGLAELFARGLDIFPSYVRNGDFDRILLRPRTAFLQALIARFHLHRLARVVGAGALAVFCLRAEAAPVTLINALLLLGALSGGALVYAGVFLLSASISIFTVQPLQWTYIFTNGSYQVAKAPPEYLPKWLRGAFTYVVPMFAFCYWPASAICGWGEPLWKGGLALPVGAAFLGASLIVWCAAVRRYKSTGS